MTEKEKMLAGMTYSAIDKQLKDELVVTAEMIHDYNALRPSDGRRLQMLKELLGHIADDEIIVNQPFYCDYGKQISVGRRFFANFNFTVLDEAQVTIGDDCFIGPNVSIYTACHSTDPAERNSRREWARPVSIGNNVWIGGSVTILPGVNIGDNVTIGAGSVVVRDIPSDCVAAGNPCKKIKDIRCTINSRQVARSRSIRHTSFPYGFPLSDGSATAGTFLRHGFCRTPHYIDVCAGRAAGTA